MMIQKNIMLKLDDNRTNNSLLFQLSPMQIVLVSKILGLDFDTSTQQVEYFDDKILEQILAYDTFLQGLDKKRTMRDIHNPDCYDIIEKEEKRREKKEKKNRFKK